MDSWSNLLRLLAGTPRRFLVTVGVIVAALLIPPVREFLYYILVLAAMIVVLGIVAYMLITGFKPKPQKK